MRIFPISNGSKEVHIGPITLTLQELYISIVTTLIVFPPSLTITMIFRKVRRARPPAVTFSAVEHITALSTGDRIGADCLVIGAHE